MPGLFDQAYIGNPNLARQGAKSRALAEQRSVDTLPDPRTYALLTGLFGVPPEDQGFSVFHPDIAGIRSAADLGNLLGIAAQAYGPAKAAASKVAPILAKNLATSTPLNTGLRNQAGAVVYHGSPHTFEKFDASKIGTGEGSQAYGHGLYFAESPEVAATYRGAKGELYKVDLPNSAIVRMLNWDKPLRNQPEILNEVLKQNWHREWQSDLYRTRPMKNIEEFTGADLYKGIRQLPEDAAYTLQRAGIPGVSYLDAASRRLGKGTHNFVLFPGEENLLTILERNGVSPNSLLGRQ